MQIVKVRYFSESGQGLSTREFTYYSVDTLCVGDIVIVPVRNTVGKAKVTAINVPEADIERFKDQVKIIPSGSVITADTITAEQATGVKPDYLPNMIPHNESQIMQLIATQSADLISFLTTQFPKATIDNEDELSLASEALLRITKYLKGAEQGRKMLVQPLNDHVKMINNAVREKTEPVVQEEQRIRRMMGAYRAKVQAERAAQYAENQKKAAEAYGAEGSPIPEVVAPLPPDTSKKVVTGEGSVQFTTVWKWEVVDLAQVPRSFLQLNEALITASVKAGLRDIPGIRIFSEQVPVVRG
jgi:hypothetical protein